MRVFVCVHAHGMCRGQRDLVADCADPGDRGEGGGVDEGKEHEEDCTPSHPGKPSRSVMSGTGPGIQLGTSAPTARCKLSNFVAHSKAPPPPLVTRTKGRLREDQVRVGKPQNSVCARAPVRGVGDVRASTHDMPLCAHMTRTSALVQGADLEMCLRT